MTGIQQSGDRPAQQPILGRESEEQVIQHWLALPRRGRLGLLRAAALLVLPRQEGFDRQAFVTSLRKVPASLAPPETEPVETVQEVLGDLLDLPLPQQRHAIELCAPRSVAGLAPGELAGYLRDLERALAQTEGSEGRAPTVH